MKQTDCNFRIRLTTAPPAGEAKPWDFYHGLCRGCTHWAVRLSVDPHGVWFRSYMGKALWVADGTYEILPERNWRQRLHVFWTRLKRGPVVPPNSGIQRRFCYTRLGRRLEKIWCEVLCFIWRTF